MISQKIIKIKVIMKLNEIMLQKKEKEGIIKLHKYTVLVVIIYLLAGLNFCINSMRMKAKKGYRVNEFDVKMSRINVDNDNMLIPFNSAE